MNHQRDFILADDGDLDKRIDEAIQTDSAGLAGTTGIISVNGSLVAPSNSFLLFQMQLQGDR